MPVSEEVPIASIADPSHNNVLEVHRPWHDRKSPTHHLRWQGLVSILSCINSGQVCLLNAAQKRYMKAGAAEHDRQGRPNTIQPPTRRRPTTCRQSHTQAPPTHARSATPTLHRDLEWSNSPNNDVPQHTIADRLRKGRERSGSMNAGHIACKTTRSNTNALDWRQT